MTMAALFGWTNLLYIFGHGGVRLGLATSGIRYRVAGAEHLPFKKGGFIMAIKAQAPIVPMAVQGGRTAMVKGSAIIRPTVVSVRVGRPIETAGLTLDDRDDLIVRVRAEIARLLAEGPVR